MIYDNIVRLCDEHGITISTLERACKIGNGTIGEWRKNGNPSIRTLTKIAEYFHITLTDLLEEEKR